MKYMVQVRYMNFLFENSEEAFCFAEFAKEHFVADSSYEKCDVTIELIADEKGDEE